MKLNMNIALTCCTIFTEAPWPVWPTWTHHGVWGMAWMPTITPAGCSSTWPLASCSTWHLSWTLRTCHSFNCRWNRDVDIFKSIKCEQEFCSVYPGGIFFYCTLTWHSYTARFNKKVSSFKLVTKSFEHDIVKLRNWGHLEVTVYLFISGTGGHL